MPVQMFGTGASLRPVQVGPHPLSAAESPLYHENSINIPALAHTLPHINPHVALSRRGALQERTTVLEGDARTRGTCITRSVCCHVCTNSDVWWEKCCARSLIVMITHQRGTHHSECCTTYTNILVAGCDTVLKNKLNTRLHAWFAWHIQYLWTFESRWSCIRNSIGHCVHLEGIFIFARSLPIFHTACD